MKFQNISIPDSKLCYAHESNKIQYPEIEKGNNSKNISFNWLKI